MSAERYFQNLRSCALEYNTEEAVEYLQNGIEELIGQNIKGIATYNSEVQHTTDDEGCSILHYEIDDSGYLSEIYSELILVEEAPSMVKFSYEKDDRIASGIVEDLDEILGENIPWETPNPDAESLVYSLP